MIQLRTWLSGVLGAVLLSALMAMAPATAQAGTNLTVTCPSVGACGVVPAATPLFDEGGWLPGSSVTQFFRVQNTSGTAGFTAVEVDNYTETNNLGEVIGIEIRRGSPVGPLVYAGVTLHDFRDDGYFTIDGISAGQTIDYFVTATMFSSAGNQYQNSQVLFDLNMGLEVAPIPPQSGGGDGAGNPGGGTTPPGPASPPVCTAQTPGSAPSVTITSVGTNTVSLSWTAVSPVTHYGVVFTRTSDGAQYGSPNVGNVTSYTVSNLSGGANYSFQVFGVNDCAPGPLGSVADTGIVPGPFIDARPLGPAGEVLGVQTESPSPSPSPTPLVAAAGQVAGESDEVCSESKRFIPWFILILQVLALAVLEYLTRKDEGWNKYFVGVGITLLSIVIFYLIRECDCYADWSWLVWLCRWYWIVATVVTILMRAFSCAFVEEIEDEKPPKTKSEHPATDPTA